MRYNQITKSGKYKVDSVDDMAKLLIFVMTLELEFLSDKDVEYAIEKFIAYDKAKLVKSAFVKALKEDIDAAKASRLLKALGANKTYEGDICFELLGLTSYLRSSVNFTMETDKRYIDKLTEVLDDDMIKFIDALYFTNKYFTLQQGYIQDYLAEIWEENLTVEKLAKRPFYYDNLAGIEYAEDESEIPDYFEIPEAQLKATIKSDKLMEAEAKKNTKKENK